MIIDPIILRLYRVVWYVLGLLVFGTAGYVWLEGWSIPDGFYMTVITLSTVGYGETQTLTPPGRWFTSGLIFLCILSMTYCTATMTSFIVGNDLSGHFFRRRHLKMISQLKDHTVVCGGGLMGQSVIERLMKERKPVVLIESNGDVLEVLCRRYPRLLVVQGSATNELTLAEANIMTAKHVVAATDSEIDNLLIAISCKDMGHDVQVYARSNDTTIANRMRKANVDEVVSPSRICGDRVADLILAR